jgi:hypothetical protein
MQSEICFLTIDAERSEMEARSGKVIGGGMSAGHSPVALGSPRQILERKTAQLAFLHRAVSRLERIHCKFRQQD